MIRNVATFNPSRLSGKQHGSTLLEVLISIVVLSMGLLGYAGLQAQSLKNNNSALQRSQATILTYDVVERMRANKPNLPSYTIAIGAVGAFPDVIAWKNNVAAALPAGDASIAINLASPPIATITIQWDDNRDDVTPPITFVTQTAL